MDRITQWVSSQEVVPADLTVRIADSVFPLHKAVMVPKCGYIRRAVAAAASQPQGLGAGAVELDLSALPGGADAFEKAARYCYGGSLEIMARDAAALRCAAAFLDAPDLARRAEDFLAQDALRSLPGAIAVLRSCECDALLPAADELDVARRAADAVALGVCNEALFPTARPGAGAPGCWAAELAELSPATFRRVLTALRCRRAGPEVVAAAAVAYAELVLAGILAPAAAPGPGRRDVAVVRADVEQRALLEAVVDALPPAADAPLPAAFLCRLLHAAVTAEASAKTCRDMELRVAGVLDQATAEDLLGVALDGAGERVRNDDTVRRVVAAFVERQQRQPQTQEGRRSSLAGAGDSDGGVALEKVAKMVDEVAAEMATEESLPISKFVGVAGAVPKDARPSHDFLYRAVDIYLKTHPGLDEIEREKVCSVMDPLRLSYQARLHASQNKRLPLHAVLSALYYDQLKLRSADGGGAGGGAEGGWETQSAAGKARAQARADSSLARENEALTSELARMRAYVSGMQQHSKGSGSRPSSSLVPAAAGKKATFLGSVSRTLSRLNPFKGGWAKDTASIADGRDRSAMHVVKPKRRRFSIG
ncbi:root phototropism protein 2-like [Miscanthus floridulus]|uniref:root phototropism protein 2-like n=1 Tax=Miscanthus floridulus TaxID=154761 RepID=UPI0034575D69